MSNLEELNETTYSIAEWNVNDWDKIGKTMASLIVFMELAGTLLLKDGGLKKLKWINFITWFRLGKLTINFFSELRNIWKGKAVSNILESLGTLNVIQWRFLLHVSKLINYAESIGYTLSAGEMYRTIEQQKIYVAKGLSKTMNSQHLKRLAFDINVFINGVYRKDAEAYKPLHEYWKSLHPNNISGYQWGWDYNHFQTN